MGIFGEQLPVAGVHPRHDRRLVFGEHVVVGQVPRQIEDEPGDAGDDQEEHGADPEEVAEDP